MSHHTANSNRRPAIIRHPPTIAVLHTRQFNRRFLSSLSREIDRITIVSPFVTPIPGFRTTLDFFRNLASRMPDSTFQFITAPPDDSKSNFLSWREARLIDQLGVDLMIRPRKLHSKVYYLQYSQGDSSTFVGSANFTKGGFQTNDETVAYWRRSESDSEVERELARLTGPGTFDLLQWSIKATTKGNFKEAEDAN